MNFSDFQVRSIRDFRIIFLFRFSLAFDFRFPNSKCLEEPEEDAVVRLSLPELELEVYLLLLMRILPNPLKKIKEFYISKNIFLLYFQLHRILRPSQSRKRNFPPTLRTTKKTRNKETPGARRQSLTENPPMVPTRNADPSISLMTAPPPAPAAPSKLNAPLPLNSVSPFFSYPPCINYFPLSHFGPINFREENKKLFQQYGSWSIGNFLCNNFQALLLLEESLALLEPVMTSPGSPSSARPPWAPPKTPLPARRRRSWTN